MTLKIDAAEKKRMKLAAVLGLLCFFFTHGYRFFQILFTGDTLLMLYQNDAAWQIALGRFVFPMLVMLRGGLAAPFLLSVLSAFWMSLAICGSVRFLKLTKWWEILALALLYTANPAFISLASTDLQCIDFYAFAIFLAVLSVQLMFRKERFTAPAAVLALVLSLGIYQAYLCVAIGLVMLHVFFSLHEHKSFGRLIKAYSKPLLCFAAAALIYFASFKLVQRMFHIWTADTYNGLAQLGNYMEGSFGASLKATYRHVWEYIRDPKVFVTSTFRGRDLSILWTWFLRLLMLALAVYSLLLLIKLWREKKPAVWQLALQLACLVLLPFGLNIVCFAAHGMQHPLMFFALCMIWLIPLLLEKELKRKYSLSLVVILFLSWSCMVYANQLYMKIEMRDVSAQNMMNRIIEEIEGTEGYVPGKTTVAFVGRFEDNPYIVPFPVIQDMEEWSMRNTAISYSGCEEAFVEYFEAVGTRMQRYESIPGEVYDMPVFPQPGYVQMLDGVMVVKLSEVSR